MVKKQNLKQEGTMAAIAAILVIFASRLNPLVSVGLSALFMVVFAVWKFRGR